MGAMGNSQCGRCAGEQGVERVDVVAGEQDVERVDVVSCPMLFDMYVVKVTDALKFTKIKAHQELKKEGLLIVREEGGVMHCIFISHQWLGLKTPDHRFLQFKYLQEALNEAEAGSLTLQT